MGAAAVGTAGLAGERLPGGACFLAGVPAALAGGVSGIRHGRAARIDQKAILCLVMLISWNSSKHVHGLINLPADHQLLDLEHQMMRGDPSNTGSVLSSRHNEILSLHGIGFLQRSQVIVFIMYPHQPSDDVLCRKQ